MRLTCEQIADRLEIEDVLARYCYAVDDRDWDAYRGLFTANAVIDDRITGGLESGVEDHVLYLTKALAKVQLSQHGITTLLIHVDGSHAKVRAQCSCPMVVNPGGAERRVFFQGLWYRNSLVLTGEGWKIAHLVEEGYWTHNMPPQFRF